MKLVRCHLLAEVSAVVDLDRPSTEYPGQYEVTEVRVVPMGSDYVMDPDDLESEEEAEATHSVDMNWYFAPLAHLPSGLVWEG